MTPRRLAQHIRWYLRELTGEAAYDRHVEHHQRTHPGSPVPTRRDYERRRHQHQDSTPNARCC